MCGGEGAGAGGLPDAFDTFMMMFDLHPHSPPAPNLAHTFTLWNNAENPQGLKSGLSREIGGNSSISMQCQHTRTPAKAQGHQDTAVLKATNGSRKVQIVGSRLWPFLQGVQMKLEGLWSCEIHGRMGI